MTTCQHCQTEFTPKRSTARFCGPTCRQATHRETGATRPPARLTDAINAKERTESHPRENVTVRNRFPGLSPEQFEATRRDFAARYPDLTPEQIVDAIAAILLPGSTLNGRQIDDIVYGQEPMVVRDVPKMAEAPYAHPAGDPWDIPDFLSRVPQEDRLAMAA
jgi:hypothetical protein